jgi:hypothetical protein
MHANIGDHIHVNGRQVGSPVRDGTIVEVLGADGSPPYIIRWDGRETSTLVYPGPDAQVWNQPFVDLQMELFGPRVK